MKSIINIITSLTLIATLFSCGSSKQDTPTEQQAVKVNIVEFGVSDVSDSFEYSGKVISDKETVLSTKLFGHVEKILVEEGEKVSKGDLLIRIKSSDVDAKLAAAAAAKREAAAATSNAKKNLDRISNLLKSGSATQREFDDVNTQFKMAEARVESIDQNIRELNHLLAYANLKSPIDGFVAQKFMNEGDMASPGQPILALESMDILKIDISVPEFEIDLFAQGDEVNLSFSSLDEPVKGFVSRLIPSTASGTQFKVSVIISSNNKVIKPGVIGKVQLFKKSTKKMIIDKKYLHSRGQLQGIYTVSQQGNAMLRWLRLGQAYGDGYEVLSGLDVGEQVITSEIGQLTNGQKVEITKSSKK